MLFLSKSNFVYFLVDLLLDIFSLNDSTQFAYEFKVLMYGELLEQKIVLLAETYVIFEFSRIFSEA